MEEHRGSGGEPGLVSQFNRGAGFSSSVIGVW
jgi:hypothetical protein